MQNQISIKTAILIPQSFQTSPLITPSSPLLDFNSQTVIEFIISWLIFNKIKQCYVLSTKSKLLIQKILLKFNQKQIKLHFIDTDQEQYSTLGDLIRLFNSKYSLKQDFILLRGDSITNLDLNRIGRQHLQRRQISSGNIITVGLSLNGNNENIYVLDNKTNRIQQIQSRKKQFKLRMSTRMPINKINQFYIRGDLRQTQIYVCSPRVLQIFSEQNHHHHMRDIIKDILNTNKYQYSIYSYILQNSQFCSNVAYPIQYYQAYFNLISRNLYPFIIQYNLKTQIDSSKPFVKYIDYNKYIKTNANLTNVKISHCTYIGEHVTIGRGSNIFRTIINKNCNIGQNSNLKYCIIAENVQLPSNSKYINSFIFIRNNILEIINYGQQLKNLQQKQFIDQIELFPQPLEEKLQPSNYAIQLQNLLNEQSSFDEIEDLKKIYKLDNRTIFRDIINILKPTNIGDIQICIKNKGEILKGLCKDGHQLIEATLEYVQYNKLRGAFHIFLQYCYKYDLLLDEQIIQWFQSNQNLQCYKYYIDLMNPFVNYLIKINQDQQQMEMSKNIKDVQTTI